MVIAVDELFETPNNFIRYPKLAERTMKKSNRFQLDAKYSSRNARSLANISMLKIIEKTMLSILNYLASFSSN